VILYYFLTVINLVTFIVYGIDKYKAQHNKWRISEATLLWLAAAGGALGAFAGMQIFRHKTKHKKFIIIVPLLMVLWIAGLLWLYSKYPSLFSQITD
jgi:uncharacterized membrane protein YsdA (DUF1294 family)